MLHYDVRDVITMQLKDAGLTIHVRFCFQRNSLQEKNGVVVVVLLHNR